MPPKPQRLIMNVMTAMEAPVIQVRDAIGICELFGVTSNSTRVALTRLSADGLIESSERGQYQLTARAHELVDDLRCWRSTMERLRAWSGDWIAVHGSVLGRSDKAALRRRNRALDMNGFRELSRDLHVRPDNLTGGIDALRERLCRLGLDDRAPVFVISDLDAGLSQTARTLWPTTKLEKAYRDTTTQMQDWLDKADRLEPEDAARESFVIGDKAIRQIVFDPLLPDGMIDSQARQTFFETLLHFDRTGHDIWRRLSRVTVAA